MNIVVCVKQVVDTAAEKRLDPASFRLDRSGENVLNPYDEYAVEEAVRLKEKHGGEVTVLCLGPDTAAEAVRKALAMGADRAVLVTDPALAGSDTQGTAYALARALEQLEFDLVLLGLMSTDAQTGQVPAALSALLDLPLLSVLNRVEVEGALLRVHRQTDQGYVAYECPLPAVLSVAKGINEPRYPALKGIMGAKKKPLEVKDAAALGLDPSRMGAGGAKTRVLAVRVPEPRKPGVKVEDDGDGARKIADFLVQEKLL
ncbi:MAG: electron transfer flavoprotein subunit beta/FixA family protein [Actinobacteria bacterium]|nr:electron transfer flavoprotein subunit beta/FixA family protein [Actinomycetota bacterium]